MKTYSTVDAVNNVIDVHVMPDTDELRLHYGRKLYTWNLTTGVLQSVNLLPLDVEQARA